ncbi:hypothetical protein EDC18_10974 [Natranaerovirga pectinivora]|uniref:Uncharacterized protein n=1 Tax=Natranaerovirga pectinivora TaxID=682400 RepID=A0A4R3MH11_9FIRM|nr:hypothetical protein [Natranaerovirga pectinivora]TCT13111.1 hypothetical protein EDC18_10974 [Natranaerovirga pectinivora]
MKHKGLITIIVTLIMITSSVKGIYMLAQEGTLYIEDIQGDSSVLENVVIKGLIQDKYVGKAFELEGNTVRYEYTLYDHHLNKKWQKGREITERLKLGRNEYLVDLRQLVMQEQRVKVGREYFTDLSVELYTDKGIGYTYTTEVVVKGVRRYIESDPDEFKSYHIDYQNLNGGNAIPFYTFVEDDIYFTITSSLGYTGKNGIFKILGLDEEEKTLDVSRLTTLELGDGDIQVYGITSIDDILILIISIDGILTVKSYDLEGKLLTIEEIGKIDLESSSYEIVVKENVVYLIVNIEWHEIKVIVFSLEDTEITTKNVSTVTTSDYSTTTEFKFFFIEDKLYTFRTDYYQFIDSRSYYNPKYEIIVTENDKLLYQGVIISQNQKGLIEYISRDTQRWLHSSDVLSLDELVIEKR